MTTKVSKTMNAVHIYIFTKVDASSGRISAVVDWSRAHWIIWP